MICSPCKERDHDHCLNFGKWTVIDRVKRFIRRIEPTKTWCDCAHEDLAAAEYLDQAKMGGGQSLDRGKVVDSSGGGF